MPKRRSHLLVSGYLDTEIFVTKRTGRNPVVPTRNRFEHGQALLEAYQNSLTTFYTNKVLENPSITEESGIYLELTSFTDCVLPLKSLDTTDFRLQSLHKVGDTEVAVIFISDNRRYKLQKKLVQYLGPDNKYGTPNRNLVDSIASIKLANLRSFWTDRPELYPENPEADFWWELWITNIAGQDDNQIISSLIDRIGIQVGQSSLKFYRNSVIIIKASAKQLELAIELISCLSELRKARDTPVVFMEMNPNEQHDWAQSLIDRSVLTEKSSLTVVSILDTGVNFNHPILALACTDHQAVSWNPAWPKYEVSNIHSWKHHGSLQAGIAMFGDMSTSIVSNDSISLNYKIESGRIIPPVGNNPPELYGAITKDTALKLEVVNPESRRVYSLAVTATNDGIGGAPSSWSAEIDNFVAGFEDGQKRLFVISAGNNRSLTTTPSFWDQAALAQIEDPAQSWNAITVGAFTNLITNNDPTYQGWTTAVVQGDLAPGSTTSISWEWQSQAPFKPDVVEEGGNKLVSPNATEITNADTVSLLTTSGQTTGALFDTTRDTSAACALVSRIAAILLSEYPDFTYETIRGLIIHSAEWTSQMLLRKQNLELTYVQQTVNKIMLRNFGYGVPNLEKARYSADNLLTLVSQNTIQPFFKEDGTPLSQDAKLNQMHLYNLPWPQEVLETLPPEMIVKLRVTLSYFVEPNPSRRGYRDRFSYQSHGLRFDVKNPIQNLDNFKAKINKLSVTDEYEGPEGVAEGWLLGSQLRTRGSVHSDTWTGSAADLANMNAIAVYPVGGWWKARVSEGRWLRSTDYSLIVTIEVPDENIDIYTDIETLIQSEIDVEINI